MIKGDIHGEQSKPLGVVFRGFSGKIFRKTIQKTSLLRTARNCSDCSQHCAEQGEKCEFTSDNNHFLTQFSAMLTVS
ncbi:MAG: hypothetical protein ACJA2B_001625 [Candidatus Endobugula sp.]|jgi:hypothetical protein